MDRLLTQFSRWAMLHLRALQRLVQPTHRLLLARSVFPRSALEMTGQIGDHSDSTLTALFRPSGASDVGMNGPDAGVKRRSAAVSCTISTVICLACLPYPEISEFSQRVFAKRGIPQENL